MVISMPNRISIAQGVSHTIMTLLACFGRAIMRRVTPGRIITIMNVDS